jgi:enediyne biosynthesis protein E8
MQPTPSSDEQVKVMTLEAFADTIVPGNKRWPGDRAVAGVSHDGGSVAAGAIELLESPAGGLSQWLVGLAAMLNAHAQNYAAEQHIELDATVPAFVSLDYDQRVAMVLRLTAWDHPERQGWVNLVMFSNMAFDTGAHLHTADALAAGHPGLLILGFAPPDADGLWRFPDYSYRRQLADIHPATTASGSPA